MADVIRGGADQGGIGDPADLHGVIGDEAVAALEQLQGGLTFADAGIPGKQHTLAVDLHQNAVDGGTGRQLQTQLGIELGGHMGGIFRGLHQRHAVLFRQLQKEGAEGEILSDDDGLGAAGKEALQALPQQVGRQSFQIGQLGTADHIDAGRDKALEEPGEGQARAHQLGVADQDLLLGFGIIEDLQVQVLDELFKRDGILVRHG